MNKENWLKIKKSGQLNIEMLFEFWEKNKKPSYKELEFNEFSKLITEYFNNGGEFSSKKLEEFFDKKFNVTKIYDKNHNLIKEI